MPLSNKEIKRIFEKYRQSFIEMEHYDRTREKLWGRKRIDITINQRIINKLKALRDKTGKPISHIIEEAVDSI
jgi:hypothetical protein